MNVAVSRPAGIDPARESGGGDPVGPVVVTGGRSVPAHPTGLEMLGERSGDGERAREARGTAWPCSDHVSITSPTNIMRAGCNCTCRYIYRNGAGHYTVNHGELFGHFELPFLHYTRYAYAGHIHLLLPVMPIQGVTQEGNLAVTNFSVMQWPFRYSAILPFPLRQGCGVDEF